MASLLSVSAFAADFVQEPPITFDGLYFSRPTGAVRSLSGTVTPYSYGGLGDAQRKQCTVTVNGTALTIDAGDGCSFTAADVGKLITIPRAGATSTTAPIASVAVSAAGSGYTSIPTVSFGSVGSGFGALATANMKLAAATVSTATGGGGAGCTNGSQTFTLDLGVAGTAATFTGTVTGGALGGALTVVTAGSYSQLPVSPSTGTVTVTGPGCTRKPAVTTTWSVDTIVVRAPGVNYPSGVTASLSGGGGSGATLSSPVLATAPREVLATTIVGFTDATHVTLGASAPNDVAAALVTLSWGSDDQAAINSCLAAAASSDVYCYIPPASSGYWGVDPATPLQLAPSGVPAKIIGAGQARSIVLALASGPYLAYRNTTFARGGTVRDIRFDGNRLVDDVGYLACPALMFFDNVAFTNAKLNAPLTVGDGTAGCNTTTLRGVVGTNGGQDDDANLYAGSNELPAYTLKIDSTDNRIRDFIGINANAAGIIATSASGRYHFTHPHLWPRASSPAAMPIGMQLRGGGYVEDISVDSDVSTYVGYDIAASNVAIVGGYIGGAASRGVLLANSSTNGSITNLNVSAIALALDRLVVTGGALPTSFRVFGNPGLLPVRFGTSACASPAAIAAGSNLMAGLHSGQAALVPTVSGLLDFQIIGDVQNSSATGTCTMGLRWGQGAPPSNGDALTGSNNGSAPQMANVDRVPFTLRWAPNALTIGQPYWIDLNINAVTGNCTARVLCATVTERE